MKTFEDLVLNLSYSNDLKLSRQICQFYSERLNAITVYKLTYSYGRRTMIDYCSKSELELIKDTYDKHAVIGRLVKIEQLNGFIEAISVIGKKTSTRFYRAIKETLYEE